MYSLDALRVELRSIPKGWLLGFVSTVIAVIAVSIMGNAELFGGINEFYLARTVTIIAVMAAVFIPRLGSRKLMKLVKNIPPEPTGEYVSLLIASMYYLGARLLAWKNLDTIVPLLSYEQVKAVDKELWKRLYKYSVAAPAEQKHIAFSLAVLNKDQQAIPYIRRILRSRNISPEMRVELENSLESLLRL